MNYSPRQKAINTYKSFLFLFVHQNGAMCSKTLYLRPFCSFLQAFPQALHTGCGIRPTCPLEFRFSKGQVCSVVCLFLRFGISIETNAPDVFTIYRAAVQDVCIADNPSRIKGRSTGGRRSPVVEQVDGDQRNSPLN